MPTTRALRTIIRDAALERMRAHARSAGAQECCGALFGRVGDKGRVVDDAVCAANAADDPMRRYLIGPDDLLRLEREARGRGLDVVGFYHSHPGGTPSPSPTDTAHAWPWYTYVIMTPGGEPTAWRLRADRGGFEPEQVEWVG